MNMSNLKIGARLGAGFGLVLILMAALLAVGMLRLTSIGAIINKTVEKDWVKAQAANVVNVGTRANARNTLELIQTSDSAASAKIHERLDANKKAIGAAIDTLDKLIYLPEGRTLLAKLKDERVRYVESFGKVLQLIQAERRAEATDMMLAETLPMLDLLQATVDKLSQLQSGIVEASGVEAARAVDSSRILMATLGCAALLAGIALACWITRSITAPIDAAVQIAQAVAAGDLSTRIEATAKDETGNLLRALRDMNDSLVRIVGQVRAGTDTIATASSQIAAGNLDLSSRTEQQASSLEETAASMEELISTVKQNVDNAHQANRQAMSASDIALKGGAVVSRVVDTMGSINDSSKKIADIIGVIDGIAFQTNILALNAAVEAARAGEQGRGFAVVATEVRNLAQRSAAAAKEIKVLIDDSVVQVDAGSKLVDQAGSTMQEIVASVKRVTDIMAEITCASQEQQAGIEQVNEAVVQLDQATQQNAALVEEASAATASLHSQADGLAQVVSLFRLGDGGACAQRPARVTAATVAQLAG
jgi:methyl-accepting chemotaxis protein